MEDLKGKYIFRKAFFPRKKKKEMKMKNSRCAFERGQIAEEKVRCNKLDYDGKKPVVKVSSDVFNFLFSLSLSG